MSDNPIPDTIGVSLDTRESLRKASQSLTALEVPGYTLTREIGRGNFGTVWQAERTKTKQQVAIKIVAHEAGLNWDYFRRELDFLRELEEHPNTLTILDAQLDGDPPFIVMPLADGGSMEESVRRDPPDLKLIELWLRQMAAALIFIHRKGVIHCDLKPSNVLLSSDRYIRIADLGQARRKGHGMALGTIGFMAPEQCDEKSMSSPSVSWDVYGFGATAYWLLTGKVPRAVEGQPYDLASYADCFENTKLVPIRRLNPKIDKELAAIIEGCLEPDVKKRIPSIDAVLSDLNRRRDNEPLLCRQPWSLLYLTRTALKRRTVQTLLVALLLALVAGWFGWQERNENRYLSHLTTGIHAHESGRLEEAYLHWLEALHYRPSNKTLNSRLQFLPLDQLYPHKARVTDLEVSRSGERLISASTDGEVVLWDSSSGQKIGDFPHSSYVSELALSPDEKLLATASWDGNARIFTLESGQMRALLSHKTEDFEPSVTNLAFCDQGRLLATADLQGSVKLWFTEDGTPKDIATLPTDLYILQVLAAHPTRPLLAALTGPNTIGVWNLETGVQLPIKLQHKEAINDLKFSPNGDFLISASDDNTAVLWDIDSGKKVREFQHDSRVNTLLVISEQQVVTGCEDGSANVWDFEKDDATDHFYHRRPVRSLGTNSDGTLLAVGTGESEILWSDTEPNGTVDVWDLQHGYQVGGPWPHDGPVETVAFSTAEPLVLSASGSARQSTAAHPGAVRAWKYVLASGPTSAPLSAPPAEPSEAKSQIVLPNGVTISHGQNVAINQYALNSAAELVATASEDRTVRLWSSLDGQQAKNPLLLSGPAKAVCFTDDGKALATAAYVSGSYSAIQLWEVETGYPITPTLACPGEVHTLSISLDGGELQSTSETGTYIWKLNLNEPKQDWDREIQHKLRAKLDARGSVVPTSVVSETVMRDKSE